MTSTPARTDELAGWKARVLHTITCPSGQRLRITLLGVGTVLQHGDFPEDLVDLAVSELTYPDGAAGRLKDDIDQAAAAGGPLDRDTILGRLHQLARFQKLLASAAIKEIETDTGWVPVTLTPDRLEELPEDDWTLVALIMQRLRNTDARGVTIGVEPIDRWAAFREAHRCAGDDREQGCEACAQLFQGLSSIHMGAL